MGHLRIEDEGLGTQKRFYDTVSLGVLRRESV